MSIIQKSRESTTLQLVIPAYFVLLAKFAVAGMTIWGFEFAQMTATEFGVAQAAVLAVWLTREWRSAHFKEKEASRNVQQT